MSVARRQLKLNNIIIESRTSDNYINATQLCKAGGKEFKHWKCLESTKNLIKTLETTLLNENSEEGISELQNIKLIDVKCGNSSKFSQGSWIHPNLIIPLAQWISAEFTVKVSFWINEWRVISEENEFKFQDALSNLKPRKSILIEKEIQNRLHIELNAQMEVETPVGFVDLVTEEKIIEIKEISRWKHAVGQILSYGVFVKKSKCIYLFGEADAIDVNNIYKVCNELNIEVIIQ